MNTRVFIISVAAVILSACTRMENPAGSNVPVSLSYSTLEADEESKAAQNLNEGTFDSGEKIKVRTSNTGAGQWTDYIFTAGDAGAMIPPDPKPYFPSGSQNIDIVAYYPATAGTSFTVAADQTSDASYKASDLMFASVTNQARQQSAVNLEFRHKLAKLCVNVTPGDGISSINSITLLGVQPTVSFNQATGAVGEASGHATDIAMSNNGAVIIPAQSLTGNLFTIVTDKGTVTFQVAFGKKTIAAGKRYTWEITISRLAVGATIDISDWMGEEGTVIVNPAQKTPYGLEAVDLGSSVKWANMNLGATKPEEYGDYFAWGETIPYYQEGYSQESPCTHWIYDKSGYNWANYSLCNGSMYSLIKYCYLSNFGVVDNRYSLDYVHDAACVNWGGNWQMPSDSDFSWLRNNCSWTKTTLNGVKGYRVEGNGNSIFLPAAGYRADAQLYDAGSYGYYWSSSLNPIDSPPWAACLDGTTISSKERYQGFTIRPVWQP